MVVGDDEADIIEALDAAAARCDAVLVSGGLGPTADDLTAGCAARAANVPLVESAQALAHLTARFAARGLTLTPNNRRQAQVPQRAEVVLNDEGSAPMFVQRRGPCTLFFVPGVPREYRHLVEHHVLPRLSALADAQGPRPVRVLRLLKTVGLPESHLDARVRPLFAAHPRVTFGFRTHAPENHLKLLAEAPSRAQALAALEEAEAASRAVLGHHVFGVDEQTLPGVVQGLLQERHQTVSSAESCTGGLLAAALTETAGASEVFLAGVTPYREDFKSKWAQVPADLLARFGVVSEQTAQALADGIRRETGSTWGVGVTGLAGPSGGTAELPVGTVCVAVSAEGVQRVERHRFGGERERVRRFATFSALDLLRRTVQERPRP